MKRLFIALFALLFSFTAAIAAEQRISPFAAPTARAEEDFNIETGTGIQLDQEARDIAIFKSKIDAEDKALRGIKVDWENKNTRWELERNSLRAEVPPVEARVQRYIGKCMVNGVPKVYNFPVNQGPPAEYYECQSEFAAVNPLKEALERRMEANEQLSNWLDTTSADYRKRKAQLSEDTLKWAAREKANRAALADHQVRKSALKAKLDSLRAQNDSCTAAINNGSIEDMKAICGFTFDGNKTKPSPKLKPKKGGMTVTPNK